MKTAEYSFLIKLFLCFLFLVVTPLVDAGNNMDKYFLRKGKQFLDENAKKEGVVVLPSGLQYKVLQKSESSVSPKNTDTVEVHYRGTLVDQKEFDSSYKRGKPAQFGVGQVIAGWTEALQLMHVGDKWEVYIPSKLGYGERGMPGSIPPNSVLIFVVELLKIVSKKDEL